MKAASATTFVRATSGRKLHRATCAMANRGGMTTSVRPWLWADGKTHAEIVAAMNEQGITACRNCLPMGYFDETGQKV